MGTKYLLMFILIYLFVPRKVVHTACRQKIAEVSMSKTVQMWSQIMCTGDVPKLWKNQSRQEWAPKTRALLTYS